MSGENNSVRSGVFNGVPEGHGGSWTTPSSASPAPQSVTRLHKLFFVCSKRAKPPPSQTVPSLARLLRDGAGETARDSEVSPPHKMFQHKHMAAEGGRGSAQPCGEEAFFLLPFPFFFPSSPVNGSLYLFFPGKLLLNPGQGKIHLGRGRVGGFTPALPAPSPLPPLPWP